MGIKSNPVIVGSLSSELDGGTSWVSKGKSDLAGTGLKKNR